MPPRTLLSPVVRQKLRRHIFSLRRGPSVYHSVLYDIRSRKNFTRLNRHRNQWPSIASKSLKDKIKSMFEREIRNHCSVQAVCASCSVKYYSEGFTAITPSDVDLDLLQIPPEDVHAARRLYSDVDSDGPLANLLIDKRGVIQDGSGPVCQLLLCMHCYRALKRSRVPKFALVNDLHLGDVPPELRDLTAVEENMIALCRAKCITVQLKSIRGTGGSQRGFRGHTIFHQQDVNTLATLLPPSIEEILAPICVLFVGSEKPSPQWIRDHAKPLIVRANVVRRALEWLILNNPLYASVRLNHSVLDRIEQEGGLSYPIEYVDVSQTSSSTVSPNSVSEIPVVNNSSPSEHSINNHDIPFENVMITDIDPTATPQELRAAALRHLKSGKPYLMYGHAPSPENEYQNTKLFPSLYPSLFPFGVGGFENPVRFPKISMVAHARHLLNIADDRFRRHPSFIFSVFNIFQWRTVAQRTTMRVCRASFENKARIYASLQPDTIQRVADQMESGSFTFDDEDERNVCDLMRDVHMINSTVQGSAAARLKMRNEICAMITSFGAPSFFITINPADVYSPVVKLLSGENIDLNNLLPDHIPDYRQQSILIAKDPVLAARFFHIYMKAFFTAVLGVQVDSESDKLPSGLFGLTKGYYGVVEAQGRGSLHCHMVIWLEGALNQREIYERVLADQTGDFEKQLIDYLDENIQSEISVDPGVIDNVPSSVHNPSSVRPVQHAPGESDVEFNKRRAKDIHNLSLQCQQHKHNDGCYKYWTGPPEEKTCRFDLDSQKRVERTCIDKATGIITTRCLDGMVNPFNELVLEILRCNMDIKFIGSGNSAHAVLYYITNYISKMQLKTHVAYNVLAVTLQRLKTYGGSGESDEQQSAKKVLIKSANAIISMQELSAQQVSASLLGNGECYASHVFKELYWRSFVNYVDHVLPDSSVQSEITDEPVPVENDTLSDTPHGATSSTGTLSIEPLSHLLSDPIAGSGTHVTAKIDAFGNLLPKAGHVADYIFRPDAMHDMSLWEFMSFTDRQYVKRRSSRAFPDPSDSDMDVDQDLTAVLQSPESQTDDSDTEDNHEPLSDTSADPYMSFVERIYRGVISPSRLVSFSSSHPDAKTHSLYVVHPHNKYVLVLSGPSLPRFDRDSSKPAFCQLMLILFKPWREARDLKLESESWLDAYELFIDSDHWKIEFDLIVRNIQFMHECRDCRDQDASAKRLKRVPVNEADDISPVLDLSSVPVDGDPSQVQDCHDVLLRDAHRQFDATILRSADYINAISLAGLMNTSNVFSHAAVADIAPNPSFTDFAALRIEWKAHYQKRRKAIKESLQSNTPTAFQPPYANPVTSIAEFHFEDLDFSPSTSFNDTFPAVQFTVSSEHSFLPHQALCHTICNHWTLNSDQKRAFMLIANHAAGASASGMPLSMIITGPAGSGKTQVINALRQLFLKQNEERRFRVASYMGIAACNVSGITLHSALNLSASHMTDASARRKSPDDLKHMWTGVDYLFIDEVSMISCEFMQTINTTLCCATGRVSPFGGLSVIFAGDMAQLPPVGETRLSAHVDPSKNASSDCHQKKLKGKLLWLSISNVVMLQKINRQSGAANARFVELLTRLRDGRCNMADYHLLLSRVVSPDCNVQHWNLPFNSLVPVVVSDNTAKDRINWELAQSFAARSNQALLSFVALDERHGSSVTDPSVSQIIALLHSGRTSSRLKHLPLVIGMPVMITTNIDLLGGIVNGSVGTVRAFDYNTLPGGEHVLNHCIVHIPSASAPTMPGLGPNEYAILPDSVQIRYQGPLSKQSLSFKRTQVPLIPAFAMTAHKSQGQTLDKAIVDLACCRGTESPYVMVSRVRSLNDLLVLRPFPLAKLRCHPSEDSRHEQLRLKYLHLKTIVAHGSPDEQLQASNNLVEFNRTYGSAQFIQDLLPLHGPNSLDASPPRKRRKTH